jgi:DNA-binding transcriptional LysR family regulator
VADLAGHDCVLFRGAHGKSEWRLTGPHGEERVTVRGPLNADEMAFVQQAVAAGVGIALLPVIGVRLTATRGALPMPVRVLPEYTVGGSGLHVVSPSARFQSASVAAFRDFLIAELTAIWSSA